MEYDNYENEGDGKKFISRDEAKKWELTGCGMFGSGQEFSCPQCGSWNTQSGTYFDKCNTCDWSVGY